MRDRSYPSDLTDAEWAALEPLLPPRPRTGRPPKWSRRVMADAIVHLVRSGCSWRMLPPHFPPWPTVHCQLARWHRDGTLKRMHDRLRELAREHEGRQAEPTAAVIDAQPARATGAGGAERGFDAGKKVWGRKRHILGDAAPPTVLPRLELIWADGADTGPFAARLAERRGWRVDVPFHRKRQAWRYGLEQKPNGFNVIPRRWVVERTFAWLSRSRRLARDYERSPETSVAMIHLATSRIMLRRVA